MKQYQQRVQAESGYSIVDEPDNIGDNSESMDLDQVSENQQQVTNLRYRRPPRISKTRAFMALKQPELLDDQDGANESSDNSVRKRSKSIVNRESKKRQATNNTGRKTKAQILLDKQLQDRLNRKRDRQNKDGEAIIQSMDHTQRKDCCLQCASNTYRILLEKGDLEGFKNCFKDVHHIPSHDQEDTPNGLHLIPYAIILKKFDFAEYATKFKPDPSISRPMVPSRYVTYDGHTGHNRKVGFYGNRHFK